MKIQLQLQRQQEREQEEEVTFVTDTIGDQSLQQDYMAFLEAESDDTSTSGSGSGSEELGLYDSNKDYSWYGRYR
jgi:hypothetical protein